MTTTQRKQLSNAYSLILSWPKKTAAHPAPASAGQLKRHRKTK